MVELASALRKARRIVIEQRDLIAEAHCLMDRALRPRLETMDDIARPEYRRYVRLLNEIDELLRRMK